MTIIKPHTSHHILFFIGGILSILLVGGGLYIFEYNALVDTRNEIDALKDSIAVVQVENAELKNTLYENIAPTKLEVLAANLSLTLDKNPEYFHLHQWRSDSSR